MWGSDMHSLTRIMPEFPDSGKFMRKKVSKQQALLEGAGKGYQKDQPTPSIDALTTTHLKLSCIGSIVTLGSELRMTLL